VIADTSGRGDTGWLMVNKDGTFSSEYKMPKRPKETASGVYTYGKKSDEAVGEEQRVLNLKMKTYNDKPAPVEAQIQLVYDRDRHILHDFISVAYARPSEAIKARKYFKRNAVK
jgi:hypothetical protein